MLNEVLSPTFSYGIKSSGQYKSQNNQSAASQIQRERTFFSGLRKLAGKSAVVAFVSWFCNRALRHFIDSNFNCNLFLIAVFICYDNREFILAGVAWIWNIRRFAIRCNSYRTMRRLFTDARDSSQRDLAVIGTSSIVVTCVACGVGVPTVPGWTGVAAGVTCGVAVTPGVLEAAGVPVGAGVTDGVGVGVPITPGMLDGSGVGV